jgi:hypothetical protein
MSFISLVPHIKKNNVRVYHETPLYFAAYLFHDNGEYAVMLKEIVDIKLFCCMLWKIGSFMQWAFRKVGNFLQLNVILYLLH